jgi:hypothetical protein
MAFPGTYNINYYKGDTLEFRIYPKRDDGSVFSLTPLKDVAYDNASTTALNTGAFYFETAGFFVSTTRGPDGVTDRHQCFAEISSDGTYVTCAIRPFDASYFTAGTTYVYDVEVRSPSTPYEYVYTLLTGTITVTDQVTGAV